MENTNKMNIDYIKKGQEVKNSVDDEDDVDDFGKSKKSSSSQSSKTPVLDTYSRDLTRLADEVN